LLEHLNAALHGYQQALELTTAGDHENCATTENQLGKVYDRAGTPAGPCAATSNPSSTKKPGEHLRSRADRYNIALFLERDGPADEALLYARAALDSVGQAPPATRSAPSGSSHACNSARRPARAYVPAPSRVHGLAFSAST